jgi:hypothetical protein
MDLTFHSIVMLPKFVGLCFTCESWDSKLEKEWKLFLARQDLELLFYGFCAWPLCSSGAKGEEEYP